MSRSHHCPKARRSVLGRRDFLQASATLGGALTMGGLTIPGLAYEAPRNLLARDIPPMPGRFPGRVVEVQDPAAVPAGVPDREAVRRMIARGMTQLTGVAEPVEAWRSMFEPGDVVGIKVNPVGNPNAISNYATIHAIVEGLESAGIKRPDIILFERYKDQFIQAGYEKNLPDGCKWDWVSETYEEEQLDLGNCDPDVFVTVDIVHAKPGVHDHRDERTRRSHLGKVITRTVNKIVSIPVLKDHGSGGVTLALKNMSHGFVNNVCRSHGTSDTNTCNLFIPAICAHPIIRQKVVLQVLDGLNAVYHRGPGAPKQYVWQYGALFFATDPVAMDRVGWEIVDAKRVEKELPPVAKAGKAGLDPTKTEAFDFRQPQHIPGAAALGLGVIDKDKIEHRVIRMPA